MSKKRTATKRGKSKGCGCLGYLVAGIVGFAVLSNGQSERSSSTTQARSTIRPTSITEVDRVSVQKLIQQPATATDTLEPTPIPLPTDTPVTLGLNSATLTKRAQEAATNTPAPINLPPTQAAAETYYINSNGDSVNGRSCSSIDCSVVTSFVVGSQVDVVGSEQGQSVSGSTLWRLVSYNGQSVYVHSGLLSTSRPAPVQTAQPLQPTQQPQVQSTVPPAPVIPAAPSGFTCPSNCDGARAMGLSPEQAATCPRLDRDKDGVACYGD